MLVMARVSPEEFPDPVVDARLAEKAGQSRVILAGGCFWCVEAVYKNLEGVSSVKSGYAGGTADTADYETVSSGTTEYLSRIPLASSIFSAAARVRSPWERSQSRSAADAISSVRYR